MQHFGDPQVKLSYRPSSNRTAIVARRGENLPGQQLGRHWAPEQRVNLHHRMLDTQEPRHRTRHLMPVPLQCKQEQLSGFLHTHEAHSLHADKLW